MKYNKQRTAFKQLNLNDRIQIEIQYSQGKSLAQIAKYLGNGRNKSTVGREIEGTPRKRQGQVQRVPSSLSSTREGKR